MAILDGQSTGTGLKRPTDPLEVLPPELVGDIFHLYIIDVHLGRPSKSQRPVFLSYVSTSWRDFVYASPLLWAHVNVTASERRVSNLYALEKRLERSQSASLSMEIMVRYHPDKDALRVLFAERARFRQMTLKVWTTPWCHDIPMEGFTQLRKLTVDTDFRIDGLSAIFSSALRLCCVEWCSPADPEPIILIGHQLLSLNLSVVPVTFTRGFEVLAACPNLRDAVIRFRDDCLNEHILMPLTRERNLLFSKLRSLELCGSGYFVDVLSSVQAPLLSRLEICWHQKNWECGFEALESVLVSSPHLEDLTLCKFLTTEDELLSIIAKNKNLVKLSIIAQRDQVRLITQRTFKLLTRQEDGSYALPLLEELCFEGPFDVPDEVVLPIIDRTSHQTTWRTVRGHVVKHAVSGLSFCIGI
ncbi:hypothetical protein PAXINDRAFT_18725 [Paxillus involutus ATCC 200175]|uniref:F-box domain-containing protein n=1 Tax=Paxillus involutus ATCC 200175 TaxID=664439 RepID=A0A0C9SYC2_PAXIN|nr:hypothetical protein PAXINDRAFT_18725 [Paxillus involutus ATCC 200175]